MDTKSATKAKPSVDNEQEKVVSIIKSCITSATQNLTVDQLHRDYKQIVGSAIPFWKFQHGSLESFLQSAPKVIQVYNRGGQLFVKAVSNEKTRHLESLVRGQKKSKSKGKNFSSLRPARRPHNLSWMPPSYCQPDPHSMPRTTSSSSSLPPKLTSSSSLPPKSPLLPISPLLPTPLLKDSVPPQPLKAPLKSPLLPPPTTHSSTKVPHTFLPLMPRYSSSYSTLSPPVPYSTPSPPVPYSAPSPPVPYSAPSPMPYSNSHFSGPNHPRSVAPTIDRNSLQKPRFSLPTNPPDWKPPIQMTKPSHKENLYNEARRKGVTDVTFSTIVSGKKRKIWISQVQFGEQKFCSYPDECPTPMEAEESAAKKALESVRSILKPSKLPQSKGFDLIAMRVKQLLTEQTVWWEHIVDLYAKQHQETVDPLWMKEANRRGVAGVKFDQPAKDNWTLALTRTTESNGDKSTPDLTTSSIKSTNNNYNNNNSSLPPPLILPDDKVWEVLVSYFKDCSQIWFRLVGEEYSDKYHNQATDMELFYMDAGDKHAPSADIKVDKYYACYHEDTWFRVQLKNVHGSTATVFFVDHGDQEDLSVSLLFDLPNQFLKLPAQSIEASLAGLSGCFNSPNLLSVAQNLVLGKVLVAEVLNRKGGSAGGEPVSVVLYDTSTDDDVNVNEQLMKVLNEYSVPALPAEGGLAEVYVTHVSATGDIFVRIESASHQHLQELLVTARKRTAEILGDTECLSVDMTKLYLAKFSPDGDWHRAAPRSTIRDAEGKVFLKALDLGIHSRVACANIIRLDKVCPALCHIPRQSLLCRIHNVPSNPKFVWTQKVSKRLVSLLPSGNEPMLLKVIEEGKDDEPSMVELFQRIQPQNLLISINATLDMDSDLFSNEDKNNNCEENGLSTKEKENGPLSSPSPSGCSSVVGNALALQSLPPPTLPKVNSFFDVVVAYAASPSHFAVQSWKDGTKLDWLMGEMKSFYSDATKLKPVSQVQPGGVYALKHKDEAWYRVRVEQISEDLLSGLFVDYGDCFCSSTDKLQPLWPNFKMLPYQAFKAKLGGIQAPNIDWTPEDSCRFRSLVEDRSFVSIVTRIQSVGGGSRSQNPPTLVLRLIDTTDPASDVYIDEILVNEKRAKKCNDED